MSNSMRIEVDTLLTFLKNGHEPEIIKLRRNRPGEIWWRYLKIGGWWTKCKHCGATIIIDPITEHGHGIGLTLNCSGPGLRRYNIRNENQ